MKRYDISPLSPGETIIETIMNALILLGFEKKLGVSGSDSCVSRYGGARMQSRETGALLGPFIS